MVDLSFTLEETSIAKVDRVVAVEGAKEAPRPYLGMSEVGHDCSRYLWLKVHEGFRDTFEGRLYRIFDTGDIIETRIVRDLRKAGYKVNRGKKANSFSDLDDKFRGHSDGIISGLIESKKKHILEIKSMNDKNFKKFLKEGIEVSHPKYYAQAQLYMGYAEIQRALFVVENKNDSTRRQERIVFSGRIYRDLWEKAFDIIHSQAPPNGISEDPTWWKCRFCQANNSEWCRKRWEGERAF